MRLLDNLLRRVRAKKDRRVDPDVVAARLAERKRGVRGERDVEDYATRGSGYVGR